MSKPRLTGWLLLLSMLALGACAETRVTDPARTASEQFLLSVAARQAVIGLSFAGLEGRRVYVDTQYFAAAEQAFVLGELRAQLLMRGVQLVRTPGDAQVILEVRSGGVGIDRSDYLFGIPPLALGGSLAAVDAGPGTVPLVTPELALVKSREQIGVASVAFVAYWAETGEVVASSGPFVGFSLRDDIWYLGAGPWTVGDIPPLERGD